MTDRQTDEEAQHAHVRGAKLADVTTLIVFRLIATGLH